jgi:hypothetical protein
MKPNLNKILLDSYSRDGLLIASRVHNLAVCSQSLRLLKDNSNQHVLGSGGVEVTTFAVNCSRVV